MKALTSSVLKRLAGGGFHSGEALARELDVSRASVWLAIRDIETLGIEVYKVRGRGYRLPQPLALLDRAAIESRLGAQAARFTLDIRDAADSTNTLLLERAAAGAAGGTVIAAEWQPGGRGQDRPQVAERRPVAGPQTRRHPHRARGRCAGTDRRGDRDRA